VVCKTVYTSSILVVASINKINRLEETSKAQKDLEILPDRLLTQLRSRTDSTQQKNPDHRLGLRCLHIRTISCPDRRFRRKTKGPRKGMREPEGNQQKQLIATANPPTIWRPSQCPVSMPKI
jgi:hypothetical protein